MMVLGLPRVAPLQMMVTRPLTALLCFTTGVWIFPGSPSLRTMMHRRIAYPSSPEVELSKGEKSKDKKVQQLFPDASEA